MINITKKALSVIMEGLFPFLPKERTPPIAFGSYKFVLV
jgi:hypothetical protein